MNIYTLVYHFSSYSASEIRAAISMNYFTVLRSKRYIALNKGLTERYLRQYLKCQVRFYAVGNENRYTKERVAGRKAMQALTLRDLRKSRRKVEGIIERENIWTVPNFLCVCRIMATPYLGYLILSHDYQIALWLLTFAGLSDLADGWIARTWSSQASKLGSFLDPVADKLLVGTLFLTLTWVHLIPVPLTCLVVTRDIALVTAASYIRYRSLPPPKTLLRYFDPTHATVQLAPTLISKVNTGVQLCLVAGTLAAPVFHFVDHPILRFLCYVTALTTLAGGASYLLSKNTYKLLKKRDTTRTSP